MSGAAPVLAFSREGSVPQWAVLLILAIPVVIMAFLLIRGIRLRARQERIRAGRLARRVDGIPLGSADRIADGGQVPWENLLEALAVRPEDHGPAGGMPHDEGWAGTMLGLKSRMSSGTGPSEPHVYWGERHGRQVLIRLGDHRTVDPIGDGGDEDIGLANGSDQFRLGERTVVDVQPGIEELAHARLDLIRQLARDHDERLLPACHCFLESGSR